MGLAGQTNFLGHTLGKGSWKETGEQEAGRRDADKCLPASVLQALGKLSVRIGHLVCTTVCVCERQREREKGGRGESLKSGSAK